MTTTPVTEAADQALADLEHQLVEATKLLGRIERVEAAIPESDDPAELRATALMCAGVARESLVSCAAILRASIASAQNTRQTSMLAAELQQRLAVDQAARPGRVIN